MFSVAHPPKLFYIPSNGSLKGCLIALVGLLTLRLPSLGWVLTRLLHHFYLISLVCLRYPLSFVLFCFLRCPTQGLAACRSFLFRLSSRFFQVDLLAQLNARIKTLEDAGNDVPAHLSKITSYGFRREDFYKYDALNLAEQLATAAKLSGHEKASTYDAIACTLREKLPFNKKQFKAYFVALLADKEYAKILEAVAKVDKSFKSSVPSTAAGSPGVPVQASARPPPRCPRIYCYACGAPGHTASRCFKQFNN